MKKQRQELDAPSWASVMYDEIWDIRKQVRDLRRQVWIGIGILLAVMFYFQTLHPIKQQNSQANQAATRDTKDSNPAQTLSQTHIQPRE
jgi:hypothetical protein